MIDKRAIVDPSARLAADVVVGPWSFIGPDVEIGPGCIIEPHVVIRGPTVIGRGNRIFQFSSVGEATPDLKYRNEPTRLVIGDNNVIRENVTIHRGTVQGRSETLIGDSNLIMANVHVAHDAVIGNHAVLVNNSALAGHVRFGDWAVLSGYTLVHQFCQIGTHAFTGMGSAIGKDVPAYVTVSGAPAQAKSVNQEGLRRRGFSADVMSQLRRAFKIVYRQNLTLDVALSRLDAMQDKGEELHNFIDSLRASGRGIVR